MFNTSKWSTQSQLTFSYTSDSDTCSCFETVALIHFIRNWSRCFGLSVSVCLCIYVTDSPINFYIRVCSNKISSSVYAWCDIWILAVICTQSHKWCNHQGLKTRGIVMMMMMILSLFLLPLGTEDSQFQVSDVIETTSSPLLTIQGHLLKDFICEIKRHISDENIIFNVYLFIYVNK